MHFLKNVGLKFWSRQKEKQEFPFFKKWDSKKGLCNNFFFFFKFLISLYSSVRCVCVCAFFSLLFVLFFFLFLSGIPCSFKLHTAGVYFSFFIFFTSSNFEWRNADRVTKRELKKNRLHVSIIISFCFCCFQNVWLKWAK